MVVHGGFELRRREAFDGAFDAPFAAVAVPDAVVEAELDFLFDVAGEVVGGDPRRVDVEGGVATVVVFVNHPHLGAVPGGAVFRADEAALAGGGDGFQFAAEGEIDELDVMDGDVGAGIAADDPFGELSAGDRFRFEQRAIAGVDVLEDVVVDEGPQFFVVRVEKFMIDDFGEELFVFRQGDEFVEFLQR